MLFISVSSDGSVEISKRVDRWSNGRTLNPLFIHAARVEECALMPACFWATLSSWIGSNEFDNHVLQ
ncbi:MAG TPA: hypothetical protein VKA78_17270 [Pyrinomonadaceae bacterium]|nr:hypothetical protein [Pyrinomonadaceae bacterium]